MCVSKVKQLKQKKIFDIFDDIFDDISEGLRYFLILIYQKKKKYR